jgi:S1-C subfamily serine protease
VAPPPRGIVTAAAVDAASGSVVKVLGTACGLGIEGSGWVAAPGVIVTNAHVVAGENDTNVQVGGNPPGLDAEVIDFDPHDDIAVLRVTGLHEPVLHLAAKPQSGTAAAILGYPLDGPFDKEPGRIGQAEVVSTEDAYGNGPVLRSITPLRGRVRPGNSGGPMIDARGQVVATVFAAITGSPSGQGGFAVPNALVRAQLKLALSRTHAVSTEACAG